MKATRIPPVVLARIEGRTSAPDEFGCTESTYSVGSHGYPQVGWHENGRRTMTLVHRAVWIAAHGPIAEGMTVDHMCKNRRCVNIEHLRLLTNYENARRTFLRDWPLGRCINGHPNSNLYRQPAGKLICRPCNRAAQARYNAKRRAD